MRIRKHAWKIIGTGSSLPPPQTPPALLAEVSSSGYICVLNQSPWDVFPSPPPHNPQEEGWMGEGIQGKQQIFTVTSITGVPGGKVPGGVEEVQCKPNLATPTQKSKKAKRKRVTVKKESGYASTPRAGGYASTPRAGVEEEQCTPNLAPTVQKSKKANGKRVTVKKKSGYDSTSKAVAPAYPCKKTDGKQWQCRRPAHKPNSLCHYHLTQIKSYSYKALLVAKEATGHRSIEKKRVTMSPATSAVSEIYYYSSFGPWRGKQRGGGDSGQHPSVVATADGKSGSEGRSCDYMDVTDDEETLEGSELEAKQKIIDTDRRMGCKKKRRKPVKARSLKSLM